MEQVQDEILWLVGDGAHGKGTTLPIEEVTDTPTSLCVDFWKDAVGDQGIKCRAPYDVPVDLGKGIKTWEMNPQDPLVVDLMRGLECARHVLVHKEKSKRWLWVVGHGSNGTSTDPWHGSHHGRGTAALAPKKDTFLRMLVRSLRGNPDAWRPYL